MEHRNNVLMEHIQKLSGPAYNFSTATFPAKLIATCLSDVEKNYVEKHCHGYSIKRHQHSIVHVAATNITALISMTSATQQLTLLAHHSASIAFARQCLRPLMVLWNKCMLLRDPIFQRFNQQCDSVKILLYRKYGCCVMVYRCNFPKP